MAAGLLVAAGLPVPEEPPATPAEPPPGTADEPPPAAPPAPPDEPPPEEPAATPGDPPPEGTPVSGPEAVMSAVLWTGLPETAQTVPSSA
ncbi:hypothetical protein ABZ858_33975 [Streptomyces sp. NPDC047017]|uniref:hypothetical protein n=1 Tax=Streptomyces sp. NPDC047017 TaxID=3155024 RepID=UPI003407EE18